MDQSDTATMRETLDREIALQNRRPAGPQPTGHCLYCEAPQPAGHRWCNAECRDGWEREQP